MANMTFIILAGYTIRLENIAMFYSYEWIHHQNKITYYYLIVYINGNSKSIEIRYTDKEKRNKDKERLYSALGLEGYNVLTDKDLEKDLDRLPFPCYTGPHEQSNASAR